MHGTNSARMTLVPKRRYIMWTKLQTHIETFLNEVQCEYGDTVCYSEIWWLSERKILQRFLPVLESVKNPYVEGQLATDLEDAVEMYDLPFLKGICWYSTCSKQPATLEMPICRWSVQQCTCFSNEIFVI